jgi:hypothetical protein
MSPVSAMDQEQRAAEVCCAPERACRCTRAQAATSLTRKIMVCVMALATLSISTARARDVLGNGSYSCSSWMENQRDKYFALIDQAWVSGYLSSYNLYASDELALPDVPAIRGWITGYCQKHPLDGIYKAADELVNELNRRASH